MVEVDTTVRKVRKAIVDGFVATGHSPSSADIAAALKITRQEVLRAFGDLPKYDTFAMERGTENVRILSPFSNLATPFKVAVDGEQRWHAVCGPESLAITYMFPGRTVAVEAHCRDCGDPIRIEMKDGEVLSQEPEGLLIHLGVPVARWFEDLPYA